VLIVATPELSLLGHERLPFQVCCYLLVMGNYILMFDRFTSILGHGTLTAMSTGAHIMLEYVSV
jgi:hypothetical protein